MNNIKTFASWSGGKDSCFALYKSMQEGAQAEFLFTMLADGGSRTNAHNLPLAVIQKQADEIGLKLISRSASWGKYEEEFKTGLSELKSYGVSHGVFGDIDIEGHRDWVEKTCSGAGLKGWHPLWGIPRRDLVRQFVEAGFVAKLVAIKSDVLDESFLGRTFNLDLIEELENLGVDSCGEAGEFHTLVVDGPIFKSPIPVEFGEIIRHGDRSYIDVSLSN